MRACARRGALLFLITPALACLIPGDETPDGSSGADTGPADSSGPTTTAASGSTTDVVDGSGSSDDGSSGPVDSSSEGPPGMCDPGCNDDELCHDGSCTPVGFSVSFGGGTSRQTFWDVAIDPAGDLVVVGHFDETMALGELPLAGEGGGLEALVAKLDPTGAPIWAHAYVNPGFAHEVARAVAIDGEGNVLVAGELQETVDFGAGPLTSAGETDVFVLKLDPAGETLWAQAFGDGEPQHVTGIAALADGGIALTGDFFGTLDLGGDPLVATGDATDVWVAALDPAGAHRWSVAAGDAEYQYAHAIAASGTDVVVCGEFRGALDIGGGPLMADLGDVFIAKLDATGGHVWSNANFDGGDDSCHAIAVDGAGNVAFTGRYVEGLDFGGDGVPDDGFDTFKYAAVFDGAGNYKWSAGFGSGTWSESGNFHDEVAFDSQGNLVLAGALTTLADFGGEVLPNDNVPSIYVAKLDPGGAHLWSATWPSPLLAQAVYGLAIDAQDDVVVAGEFAGELDLGFGPMTTEVSPDALVARFLPTGPG